MSRLTDIYLGNTLTYTYGYDQQRIRSYLIISDNRFINKDYVGLCEYNTEYFVDGGAIQTTFTYLVGPYGVFAVVEKENNSESIHYILKDHLGSWTSITDSEGNVEQEISFDAWGNLRDPETWLNYPTDETTLSLMFDRGFTGHEHMTTFGLINMNGRCYDPLTSSFLSVDAYVQSPDNAQSFNRYAYCQNNPLRYVDPSGWYMQGASYGTPVTGSSWGESYSQHAYEWREICNPGARDAVADALLTSFKCGGGGCVISGNLVIGEDGRIEDINNIAIYCNSRFDKQELLVMPTATSGRCVLIGLGGTKKYWYSSTKKYADGTKKWDEKASLFMKATGKTFNTNIQDLIEFIEWNDEKMTFSNYEASVILISQIYEALKNDYVVAACVELNNEDDIQLNNGQSGHFANISQYISNDSGVEIVFIEPVGTSFMESYKAEHTNYYIDQPFLNACIFIKYKFKP